jgi:hypothetical protein
VTPEGPGAAPAAGYVCTVVHAFVLIDGEPGRVADLAVELAGVDGVSEVYSALGRSTCRC